MAKFCSNCGAELNETQMVCLKCGVLINNEEEKNKTRNEETAEKSASTGLTLGIISIFAWLIPIAGYPVTICGIVNSIKGLKSSKNNSKAIVGLVLSIIFLIITLINSIAGVLMMYE